MRAGTRFREPYAISGGSPAVTVVVAVNNQPSLLVTRAVPSVCRQTYDDWELDIVDDASTEDIGAAVAPWLSDRRIRLVRRPVNGGPQLHATPESGRQGVDSCAFWTMTTSTSTTNSPVR